MKTKNRKVDIDLWRLVASFMIVAIHTYPLSSISTDLDYVFTRILFRVCVPLFLMITGYYVLPSALKDRNSLINYTRKIIIMYIIATLIYIPINIYTGHIVECGIGPLIKEFVFDGTFYHLWYFPASILGLWITYYSIGKMDIKVAVGISAILLVIGLFGDSYYGLISDIPILERFYDVLFFFTSYTRNGVFYVPIFLVIGYLVSINSSSNSRKKLLFIGISFSILMTIEGWLLYSNGIPRHNSMYIALVPTCYYLFRGIMCNGVTSNKTMRSLATWIYVWHPLFIVLIRFVGNCLSMDILYTNSILNYFLVSICSLAISFIIIKGRTFFKV